MKKLVFAFCIFIVLFAACAKKSTENDNRNAEHIENYISELKKIEQNTSEKFNVLMALLENTDENSNDSVSMQINDAIIKSIEANRNAVEEFRVLAGKKSPDFVDDTIQILLRTATGLLGQSYEIRTEAMTWLNRYISLGTTRFFNEYSQKMEAAMQASKQAFFFLTTARVRQRVIVGDTLDMTIQEFLNIPELPVDTTANIELPDETAVSE